MSKTAAVQAQGLEEIGVRFGPPFEEEDRSYRGVDKNFRQQNDGKLLALADCSRGCYTSADPADVLVGNVPCPNGHGSVGWSS